MAAGTMRTVRWVLVGVGVALVGVVLGFIGHAHHRVQNFLTGLPSHMGVNITKETDNFTYSQSVKGKTVFTVHAGKAIQRKDGKIALRDVGIVLYGRSGDRADRVYGQEFEYDQKDRVLRAVGVAMIDLGAPKGGNDPARMIHVKTIGMVVKEADRSAVTDGAVEFQAQGLTGSAVGASYESASGVVVLKSAVKVSGVRNERPMTLTASRAEMDRAGNVVRLEGPHYQAVSDAGAESMTAARAVVHLTEDGSPKDVQAEGRVVLAGDGRGTVNAERLDVELNAAGGLATGHLYGGVRYGNETTAKKETGAGRDVRVAFDAAGRPVHGVVTGAVEMVETSVLSTRKLNAEKVEMAFSGGGKQKLVLRGAVASGGDGARLRFEDRAGSTGVRADVLTGRFGAVGLTGLDGAGKTLVERGGMDAHGVRTVETSTGESLQVELKPSGKGKMELARVTQHGGVEIVRAVGAEVQHARGVDAVYDAASNRVLLTGAAQVSDQTSVLFADRVEMDRTTGEANAEGAVRVSYAGKPGEEPVHVIAGSAVATKASGVTEFTAAAGGRVRMWQAGAQLEAGVIDLDKGRRTLHARGGEVRTVLAGDGKGKGAVRVFSEELVYVDAAREIDFKGHVRVEDGVGTMRAGAAIVYLNAAAKGATPAVLPAGRVERVVGTGAVVLEEPGRRATGEKLVYTAADASYVLTGGPPKLTDEGRGTVTGAALRFRSGEDSVVVEGGDGGRVRSEPRVRQ